MPYTNGEHSSQVVGYLRVSTGEQGDSGAGLQAQEEAIEREVIRRGWTLVGTYTDVASAKSRAKRPQLDAALAEIRAGRAGTLMVSKLDRLSRSVMDFATLMADAHKNGWNIVVIDINIDLSTPVGEVVAVIMSALSQWERRMIGQRTKDALASRRRRGVRLGRPVSLADDTGELIVLLRNTGHSFHAIAKRLNDDRVPTAQGGTRWHASSVRAVFERMIRPDTQETTPNGEPS